MDEHRDGSAAEATGEGTPANLVKTKHQEFREQRGKIAFLSWKSSAIWWHINFKSSSAQSLFSSKFLSSWTTGRQWLGRADIWKCQQQQGFKILTQYWRKVFCDTVNAISSFLTKSVSSLDYSVELLPYWAILLLYIVKMWHYCVTLLAAVGLSCQIRMINIGLT